MSSWIRRGVAAVSAVVLGGLAAWALVAVASIPTVYSGPAVAGPGSGNTDETPPSREDELTTLPFLEGPPALIKRDTATPVDGTASSPQQRRPTIPGTAPQPLTLTGSTTPTAAPTPAPTPTPTPAPTPTPTPSLTSTPTPTPDPTPTEVPSPDPTAVP